MSWSSEVTVSQELWDEAMRDRETRGLVSPWQEHPLPTPKGRQITQLRNVHTGQIVTTKAIVERARYESKVERQKQEDAWRQVLAEREREREARVDRLRKAIAEADDALLRRALLEVVEVGAEYEGCSTSYGEGMECDVWDAISSVLDPQQQPG